MNEPYWGSLAPDVFEANRLAPLYVSVANAVRAQKPDLLLFAEPAASRNLGLASKLPPLGVGGVVYAPHSYDGDAERGLGFDPSRRAVLMDNVAKLKLEADALGAALVLGEYGGVAANPGIAEYMDATYAATGVAAAGALYWHYGKDDGYGLLAADGGVKPALLAAVARPFPERTAGEPRGFWVDGGVFEATWSPDPAVTAPTVIAVPTETWPAGFTAQCTGCTATVLEGRVEVTAAPGATTATLVLHR
jgi:endoglycosylceramidase